jgi:hypothetical protein
MQQGVETSGKGFVNSGGNISSNAASTGPAKPLGRRGKELA